MCEKDVYSHNTSTLVLWSPSGLTSRMHAVYALMTFVVHQIKLNKLCFMKTNGTNINEKQRDQ